MTRVRDQLDAGQIAMKASAKTKFTYVMRFTLEDTADANDTNSVFYVPGIVSSNNGTLGSPAEVMKIVFVRGTNGQPLKVPGAPLLASPSSSLINLHRLRPRTSHHVHIFRNGGSVMYLLSIDLERRYAEKAELFDRRWELGGDQYREMASSLHASKVGFETVLCTHFRLSLAYVFRAGEGYAG